MAISDTDRCAPYANEDEYVAGVSEDARAVEHRRAALDALAAGRESVAVVEALLSVAERVSELSVYVSRLG
jgi:hypothetical protein